MTGHDHTTGADVVVLGNAREELVVRTRRLPAAGEALEGGVLAREPGGKGLRLALVAARLGARVVLITRVGHDANGDEILARLRLEGVRTEHVAHDPDASTGLALVHEDRRGRRSAAILSQRASAAPSLDDVRAAEDAIQHASAVVASLEAPPACIAEAFRVAHRHATQAILDAQPGREVPGRSLRLADVLIVSGRDARAVAGTSVRGRRSALRAARSLLRRITGGAVVLTTRRAALLLTRNDEIWIPRPRGAATDTPESSDAFSAALAVALAGEPDLARAGRLAIAAAALAAPARGEPLRPPTWPEVTALAGEITGGEELTLDGVLPADAPEAPAHPAE